MIKDGRSLLILYTNGETDKWEAGLEDYETASACLESSDTDYHDLLILGMIDQAEHDRIQAEKQANWQDRQTQDAITQAWRFYHKYGKDFFPRPKVYPKSVQSQIDAADWASTQATEKLITFAGANYIIKRSDCV